MELTIRMATAADEPAVRDCTVAAFTRYIPSIGREPAPMLADFAAQIAAGHVYMSVDEATQLQGVIVFYPRGDAMFLENVAVLPAAAGKGIGKALIAFCEETARRMGYTFVRLYTNEKMTANLSIYPHLGYAETGRRTDEGYQRVFYEKRLR